MRSPEALSKLTCIPNEIQANQIRSRQEIVRAWGIGEGERLLEIGCGQGDTTVVLADVVGPEGHIFATDRAGAEYGMPVTLGEASNHLEIGEFRERLTFFLGFDVLSDQLPDSTFNGIVMAHCSWYFDSASELACTLKRVVHLAEYLYLSEWDHIISRPGQTGHYMAVQAQMGMQLHEANVRTLLKREELKHLLDQAGWEILDDADINTSGLEDGRWEMEMFPEVKASLGHLSAYEIGASLGSFAIKAKRR